MQPLAYIDVFLEKIIGLSQGPKHRRFHMWRTFLHAMDKVLRLLDRDGAPQKKEVLSLKNLDTCDCNYYKCQLLLGGSYKH